MFFLIVRSTLRHQPRNLHGFPQNRRVKDRRMSSSVARDLNALISLDFHANEQEHLTEVLQDYFTSADYSDSDSDYDNEDNTQSK